MLLGRRNPAELGYVLDDAARILVADDDPILREFAALHLATPKVTVETVEDGLAAWERLQSSDFDLAMVDLEMPRLDGLGLIMRVREDSRLSGLPIVVVTGRDDLFAIDRAYEVGATSYVTKPINWRLLTYQLRFVLRADRAARAGAQSGPPAADGAAA
ncbi:response regulator [Alsobacter soli]|uniref:Response regulator n=1 Tax=Alsobacter soli TaxID=2109933 RepID=A0A2T1HZ56_9HYPH|nr:response regulator [Alsobacter soli]PSC06870.1 response regulator [Alsobacter soli]